MRTQHARAMFACVAGHLRAGAGVMSQRKFPKYPREPENNRRCDDQMHHQRKGLPQGFDQQSRRDVRDDHHRNYPAENYPEQSRENYVRIPRNVEKVEITIDQALRANDPKAHLRQTQHDRVMHGDPEAKRREVEQNRKWGWHNAELRQRDANHYGAEQGVYDAVESKLFRGHGKLAVDRQHKQRIQFSGADKFRNVCDVNEEERLKKLGDHLVGADQQHDLPLCPIADPIHIAEDDAKKNNLSAEPKYFDDHPQEEVRLETHLANERVPQHDGINFDVTAHRLFLSPTYTRSQPPLT